jgi:uncharacterized glyoxalase superfamily protein PhnB
MTGIAGNIVSTIIPSMRYYATLTAIEWPYRAFGFEKMLFVPGENGAIAHAQLVFGSGIIMLGSANDNQFGKFVKPPREVGGVDTQSAYIIVQGANAYYARAAATGTEIIIAIKAADYGGRGYLRRDPGGQAWNFDTCDLWAQEHA